MIIRVATLAALLVTTAHLNAQSPPLLLHTFDESTGGWAAAGPNTRVSVSTQTSFNGSGSLRFDYEVAKGKISALTLQTPFRVLEHAQRLRFWVNVDHAASLALILQEKTGARYMAPFSAPARTWQQVALTRNDFAVMDGLGGPADANGRLDMDQVISIAILDFGQMFASLPESESTRGLASREGKRVLYLDDFTVLRDLPAETAAGRGAVIDDFSRPQPQWIGIGGVSLRRVGDTPETGPGLRAEYTQSPGQFIALLRLVRPGSLSGMTRLAMNIGSVQSAMLLIQVEEAGGGKFNTMTTVKEGSAGDACVLDFSTFTPADDSPVKGRNVDPARITRLLILDAYGMMEMPLTQPNVLTIRDVRALPAP